MEKSSVVWGGITVLEPVTTFTDLIVVGVCIWAFWRLKHHAEPEDAIKSFRWYFIFMALTTFIAAIFGHAFFYVTDGMGKALSWTLGTIPAFFIEKGSIHLLRGSVSQRVERNAIAFIFLKGIIFTALIAWPETRSFSLVKLNSGFGMAAIVLPIHAYLHTQKKFPGHRWIVLAVLIGVIPGIIHTNQINIDPLWFNYHDICHLLMAMVFYLIYKGVDEIGTFHAERGVQPAVQ